MAKDNWNDLCKLVENDDGLPTRPAGQWTQDKLFFWNRYIAITTTAMADKPQWAGLTYVDLFAGPGICTLKENGKRIPGSVLIAANAPKPFQRIIACELDRGLATACSTRLQGSPTASRCQVIQGDCNKKISEIVAAIPDRSLTLAFVDPAGLDARFVTIETLTAGRQVDLLVLFADAYDIVRNVDGYVRQKNSKLDQVLGPESNWREKLGQLANQSSTNIRKLFANIYKEQLRQLLGYKVFGEKVMSSTNGPLYRLIYASKHERGLEFWDKVTKKDQGGQLGFTFDE